MRDPDQATETEYASVRGESELTVENFLRWERIKLREASRDAIQLLESAATPTREYLDYMFTSDVGFREIRGRIAKHRDRISELEAIQQNAGLRFPGE